MLMRITPHDGMTLEIDFGSGWHTIGKIPLKSPIAFRMEELMIDPDPENLESEPEDLEPPPPALAPRRWKIRAMRMMSRIVALPCLPIPVVLLLILAALHCLVSIAGSVLPIRPIKTITRELFMGHLRLCIAIEGALMAE